MPAPIVYDDLYLAEEAMICLLKQVLPSANYVRDSDRHSSTPPERISVKAETMEIPGGDIFDINYSILIIAPGNAATPTDAARRQTVRTITNYLRSLQGRSLFFADLFCALHGPTLGKPEEGSCRDITEDHNNLDEIVLTCGGQRNLTEVKFMEDCGFPTVAKGTLSGTGVNLATGWVTSSDFSVTMTFNPATDLSGSSGEFLITLPEAIPPTDTQFIVIEITVTAGTAPGECSIVFAGQDSEAYPTGFTPLVLSTSGGAVAAAVYTYRLSRSDAILQYAQVYPTPAS